MVFLFGSLFRSFRHRHVDEEKTASVEMGAFWRGKAMHKRVKNYVGQFAQAFVFMQRRCLQTILGTYCVILSAQLVLTEAEERNLFSYHFFLYPLCLLRALCRSF
jgi:hypothetical protein